MEGLPFERVIIDSRCADSGNASSFEVTLPETLHMPNDAVCYVTDIAISHSFLTVDGESLIGSRNHYLYFIERNWINEDVVILNRAELSTKSYAPEELAIEIQTRMNEVSLFNASGPPYTVVYHNQRNMYTITLDYTHPLPIFQDRFGFFVVNKDLLEDNDFQSYVASRTKIGNTLAPYVINFSEPQDCCGILGFSKGSSGIKKWPELAIDLAQQTNSLNTKQDTLHVDMRNRHVIYLHSNALSSLRTIGPSGSRTVIARVPLNSIYQGVVTRTHSGHPLDCVPCGHKTLRTLDFSLKDSFNRLIDMRGGHVSFELLFAPRPLV